MRGLRGKRMVVAGAGGGIGRALAIRLAEEGAHVMIAGVTEAKLPESARLAEAGAARFGNGGSVHTQLFDIADQGSVDRLVESSVQKLGGLDGIAIPAADVSLSTFRADQPIPNAAPEIWDRILNVNLIGQVRLIQAAFPFLKAAGGGTIIGISSNSAFMGRGSAPGYAVSKAGLQALVRHVARVGGVDNIRCNAVSPGLAVDPDRQLPETANVSEILESQAINRLGSYEDIAAMMAFLMSDDAEWITGQVISINGGTSFRD